MLKQWVQPHTSLGILLISLLSGCETGAPAIPPLLITQGTVHLSLAVPTDVQRLAILYSSTSRPEWLDGYRRLEGATFRLKEHRPSLKIIDRFHLPAVLKEQRFQMGGTVSDETAVRLGRLIGVDSVLIYRIDGPTLRDRLWARQHWDLPPITVTSKIIRVESAEVIFHNVVTARAEDMSGWSWSLSEASDMQRFSRAALEQGITHTMMDLQRAFQ